MRAKRRRRPGRRWDKFSHPLLRQSPLRRQVQPLPRLTLTRRKLRSRRDLTVKWANSTPRVSCVSPRGAFYAYPRIDIPEGDDIFVRELILQKHVMVVHGSGFGQKPGTKHFRIVFLPDEKILTKAYAAIGELLQERYQ